MSEIDFDELDKAVKQLMGGAPQTAPDDEPKQKTLTITNTLQPGEKPTYDKLGKVAEGIGSETLVTAGERNVVETLDGAMPTDGRPPELPIGAIASPAMQAQVPTSSASVSPVAPRPVARGRFMDMVHSSSVAAPVTPQVSSTPVSPATATVPVTPKTITTPTTPSTSVTVATDEPLRTPFLPDTKVEKRPLGAAEPAAVSTDVADVLADSASKQYDSIETPAQPEQVVAQPAVERDAQSPADPTIEVASAESIALQKIESATVATDSEQPGGIYDVNSYHQPINHPAKQKSGWSVVVIILVIVILAAALGAGAYFALGLGN